MTNVPAGLSTRTRWATPSARLGSATRVPWLTKYRQLLDEMETEVQDGGCLIDWHACDLFPRRWIDLVVVLRVSSSTLYDRLKER